MPENKLMAQRQQAVHLRRAGLSVNQVAESVGRSQNWVRKWWQRYQAEGWDGLEERSRAPKQQSRKLSDQVRREICIARSELEVEAVRDEGLKYIGAPAVRTRLKQKRITPLPSRASIERVLSEFEMTRPKQKTSKELIEYPLLKPTQPHQLCQVDIVPHFLRGGKRMACFNGIDVVSRYPTGQPFGQRRSQDAVEFLVHLWQELGIARYTQVDNEGCFSGGATHKYVLGKVVRLALTVGTELVFSPFYEPRCNGSVERFHQDYDRHVWEDTYLRHHYDVQTRSKTFFDRYRHSQHHTALNGQSPHKVHHQQLPTRLPADFVLPATKLPLTEGRIHFIRQVENDTVKVLNAYWAVPQPDPAKGVWVTLHFQTTGALLSIYDAAPDVPTRQCLVSYPFPLNEPVLPRNQEPDLTAQADQTPSPRLLPPPTPDQPLSNQSAGQLLLALITRTVLSANRFIHTMF